MCYLRQCPIIEFLILSKSLVHSTSLEEALSLELLNPSLGTVLGQIILVVLVAHETAELAVTLSLGFGVLVSIGGSEAEHLASLGLKEVVKLTGSITIVVSVSLLVSNAEDGNLGSIQFDVGQGVV